MKTCFALLFLVSLFVACTPPHPRTWRDVQEYFSKADSTTTYTDIIKQLGKPIDEYNTPSLADEHILNYSVPNEPDSVYWVMLDSHTRRFRYWSNQKFGR